MVLRGHRGNMINQNSESQTNVVTEMDASRERALACARAAIDKKAENVKILDLSQFSGFTDYFVIASGMSDRQVQAIAESVESSMDAAGHELLSREGYSEGRWVLMDFGDVVVHI